MPPGHHVRWVRVNWYFGQQKGTSGFSGNRTCCSEPSCRFNASLLDGVVLVSVAAVAHHNTDARKMERREKCEMWRCR